MARTLQERVTRELEEAIGVCENYRSVERASGEVVVYDSERGAPEDRRRNAPLVATLL